MELTPVTDTLKFVLDITDGEKTITRTVSFANVKKAITTEHLAQLANSVSSILTYEIKDIFVDKRFVLA
jgi:hypothetical protein